MTKEVMEKHLSEAIDHLRIVQEHFNKIPKKHGAIKLDLSIAMKKAHGLIAKVYEI